MQVENREEEKTQKAIQQRQKTLKQQEDVTRKQAVTDSSVDEVCFIILSMNEISHVNRLSLIAL